MDADYETLTHATRTPQMPLSYDESLFNNAAVSQKNLRYNLPANAPLPLPSYIDPPLTPTPYGTPYPSNGYSSFDSNETMNAGIPQFYSTSGVPVASWPSLEDARNSPSVPAGPATVAIIAETHFKEGFKQGLEHYTPPTCTGSIDHLTSCPICSHYVNGDKKFYKIAIGFLIILILLLLWMLFRKIPIRKP